MQADKTTLDDLSIFHHDEDNSIFHLLDFTLTAGGKEWQRRFLSNPFNSIFYIEETQLILKRMIVVQEQWAHTKVTNGTIMVVQTFFESAIQEMPAHPGYVNSAAYRIFNSGDFSLVRYSVKHFSDFLIGMQQIMQLLSVAVNPPLLQTIVDRVKTLLNKPALQQLLSMPPEKKLSVQVIMELGYFLKRSFKRETAELVEIYSKLDAWYSMATACKKYQFCFPSFIQSDASLLNAQQLYHPLLPSAVAYDVKLSPEKNFLFLTGANMGGKSTFIKATGVAVYLAHVGMGVPAKTMELSLFDGLLSNINVGDNLSKGESYFYNEVQRVKATVAKLLDGKKWLVLIDELFKGTNVEDAMKCSTVVIEGLLKNKHAVFILSTHLYEIGAALKKYPNIIFNYFETTVKDGQLIFNYSLKEGISNDRLGYLILKKEGVVDMLEQL